MPIRSNFRSRLDRRDQALREAGHTDISRVTAAILTGLFVLALAAPPVAELVSGARATRAPLVAAGELVRGWERAGIALADWKLPAANGELLAAIGRAEDRLEDESLLRRRLLPPVQAVLTSFFGLGNEEAYVGRAGWLFYRPGVDYSIGRGFLEPDELVRREQSLDAPAGLQPDAVKALRHFADQLSRRGITLLVVPVPGKTVIHPQQLLPRGRAIQPPVHNPSFGVFVDRLESAGIAVYDPTADLVALAGSGDAAFLRSDSHWTPRAVELVAAAIARRTESLVELEEPSESFSRRAVMLSGRGDLAAMLRLPAEGGHLEQEQVEVRRVQLDDGRNWRPQRTAQVLLLGDSFANVFSDPALGWGSSGGLAEQLSFELGRPVDRIARNAGGAFHAREELARELAAGRDRLARTRVVVYQFAVRELSSGDWRMVDLF